MKEYLEPTKKTLQSATPEIKSAPIQVPTKGERIKEIFEIISKLPSFRNDKEAYEALEKTFDQVEEKYYPQFVSRFQESGPSNDIFKMRVNGIDGYIRNGDKKIGVIKSEKNYTFIAKNGAIEVQMKEEGKALVDENPKNKIIFQKLGLDGKGVWE